MLIAELKPVLNTLEVLSDKDNQRQANETAILAGFFAGEGYIGIRKDTKKSKSPNLSVEVGNTESVWPSLFKQRFGGWLRVQDTAKYHANALPYYKWMIKGDAAGYFLQAIYPFLIGEKRQQAELAFELMAIRGKRLNRGITGEHGHFNHEEIVAMEEIELRLKNLRCAAAENKRMGATSLRSDVPTLPVMAA